MSERSAMDVLVAARERIADPKRWTQNAMARKQGGFPALPSSRLAVRWCAVGAVMAESTRPDAALDVLWRYGMKRQGPGLSVFNDSHSHAEVLAAFDRAIQASEEPS